MEIFILPGMTAFIESNLFTNITGVPQDIRVSNISASRFEEGRAYATFDGHFLNDFHTYVYVTENFGKTWSCINSNLPVKETCYIIREGIKNPDLLFLGTESSLWVSLNRGKSWSRYQNWVLDQYTKGYFPTVKILSMEYPAPGIRTHCRHPLVAVFILSLLLHLNL